MDFAKINPDESALDIDAHFSNFLRFGGLPGIHRMNWDSNLIDQYLSDIYGSVLLKDVISRNNIRDTELLRKIILFLMDNIGVPESDRSGMDNGRKQRRTRLPCTRPHACFPRCIEHVQTHYGRKHLRAAGDNAARPKTRQLGRIV